MKRLLLALLSFAFLYQTQGQIVTNVSYLRSLLDTTNYLPTDGTNYYQVTGIVTTHTNVTTTANTFFYMQDATAGIAVFITNGSPIRPKAGDQVQVTGTLTHFNGLLEIGLHITNTSAGVVILTTNNPLVTPTQFDFAWQFDASVAEQQEAKLVVVSNVAIGATGVFGSGANYVITNLDTLEEAVLRIDSRIASVIGQPIPQGPVSIIGVLGQADFDNPRTTGYQILPTRLEDIIGLKPAPIVRFTNVLSNLARTGDLPTNSFLETPLRPGEKLTMHVSVLDQTNGNVSIAPITSNLPPSAFWTVGATNGTNVTLTFTYQPTAAQAGSNLMVQLLTASTVTTNLRKWSIYTPNALEQNLHIGEFLANATTNTNFPSYDPLRRPAFSGNRFTGDEFVEIVNLNSFAVDLTGWAFADSLSNRHIFFPFDTTIVEASNSLIVFGGTFFDDPGIPGLTFAASSEGLLGLNDTGDLLQLRNTNGFLVYRVAYTNGVSTQDIVDIANNATMTRFPSMNGDFVSQTWVANTNGASPGKQYDGLAYSTPIAALDPIPLAEPTILSNGAFQARWVADTNRVQTVWRADTMTNRFRVVFGIKPTNTFGFFTDSSITNASRTNRYYFFTAPTTP